MAFQNLEDLEKLEFLQLGHWKQNLKSVLVC